ASGRLRPAPDLGAGGGAGEVAELPAVDDVGVAQVAGDVEHVQDEAAVGGPVAVLVDEVVDGAAALDLVVGDPRVDVADHDRGARVRLLAGAGLGLLAFH